MSTETKSHQDAMEAAYDALGGRTAVQEMFGVGGSSLSNWKTAGGFPKHLHWAVYTELSGRGFQVDPTDISSLRKIDAA